jgi:pimeloyl-ACP methyl ester carboxylesterase
MSAFYRESIPVQLNSLFLRPLTFSFATLTIAGHSKRSTAMNTVCTHSESTRLNRATKLFCLPYAGGSAAVFRRWPALLAPRVAVIPVELPGRGMRRGEPPATDLQTLVNILYGSLHKEFSGSFAFFGHSMGAVVAYELSRALLARTGTQPRRLIVSGRRAPQLPPSRAPMHGLPHDKFTAELPPGRHAGGSVGGRRTNAVVCADAARRFPIG